MVNSLVFTRYPRDPRRMKCAREPRLCRVAGREQWHVYDARRRISTRTADRIEAERFLADYRKEAARPNLALTWDRVDLDRRLVDFREPGAAASRKRRVPVPINDTLAAALAAAKDQATSRHVVEWSGGAVGSVKHGVASAAKRAGLADVSPHTFRHTAATWMAQAGVPLWQVAGMLGHSNVAMVAQVYGHHHPDHLREAAKALAWPPLKP